jgi:tight adherence protein B
MRERTRMKGEIKALTAEGRASALMLVVMVPALGGFMAMSNWAYMSPLFQTGIGKVLVGVSTAMILGGFFWMNGMTKIEI